MTPEKLQSEIRQRVKRMSDASGEEGAEMLENYDVLHMGNPQGLELLQDLYDACEEYSDNPLDFVAGVVYANLIYTTDLAGNCDCSDCSCQPGSFNVQISEN